MTARAARARIGSAIGFLVCRTVALRRYKRHLLSTWQRPEQRSPLDRLIFWTVFYYWVRHEYLAVGDPDERERRKGDVMGGLSGEAWAMAYDAQPIDLGARLGTMTYAEANPVLPVLARALGEASAPVTVIQVGSCSGRELAWLAAHHPAHDYLGIDIYPEMIAFATAKHGAANVRFELAGAKAIGGVVARATGRATIVLSTGALTYVQPEHVRAFFAALAAAPRLECLVVEPANDATGSPDALAGSRWRADLSYTHDYGWYAERAGMRTIESRVIRPFLPYAAFPSYLQHTVHYFYRGISGL